jgi:predicted nucleotidyltransferase
MSEQDLKDFATRVIREEFAAREIVVKQIILFGSQARGDAKPDSDWDFLVVTGKKISWTEKIDIWLKLARRLVTKAITADILIKFEPDFERDRNDVGKTTYYAAREGTLV